MKIKIFNTLLFWLTVALCHAVLQTVHTVW